LHSVCLALLILHQAGSNPELSSIGACTERYRNMLLRATWLFAGLVILVPGIGPGTLLARDPSTNRPVTSAPASSGHEPAHPLEHRLLRDIEDGIARVEPWLQRYGYGAIFAAVGVEGFGVPAPGQTILEAGAAASASPGGRLRIGWILLTAFLAASLGNSLGYLIGRSGGRELLQRLRIDQRHLDKAERAFERYGGWLIVFARFFDGPRQLNGIAAGILEMPWTRFTLYNLVGAAFWACFWGLAVYYLDLHLDQAVALMRHLNPWVAGVSLVGLGVLVALVWRRSSFRGGL
jgi:membrane protein DedA with SNARE-associated domain